MAGVGQEDREMDVRWRSYQRRFGCLLLCGIGLMGSRAAWADDALRQTTALLGEASLEELLDTQITTVARRVGRVADSAAAVTVISAEDIRHAATSRIEDLFRIVPGMQVGRIDNSHYAISTRGANSMFSANLLVMIDGRTVYSPVFSGVWWDSQEIPLEEIARIEIVRGPGAALWGMNAVNGVINIITKDAAHTRGGLLSASTGSMEQETVYARYGFQWGEQGYARIYARQAASSDSALPSGALAQDASQAARAGFRLDHHDGESRKLNLTGETYRLDGSNSMMTVAGATPMTTVTAPVGSPQQGGHLMGRYTQPVRVGQFMVQANYIREELASRGLGFAYRRATWDVDFQHDFDLGAHHLVWGGGVRQHRFDGASGAQLNFTRPHFTERRSHLFVQDELGLLEDRLRITLGSRFEQAPGVGVQVQPTLRALYAFSPRESLWASISRAARNPHWGQKYIRILQEWQAAGCVPVLPGLPCAVSVTGNPQSQAEKFNTLEVGYRTHLREGLSLDATVFASRGRQLQSMDINPAQVSVQPGYVSLPLQSGNQAAATSRGLELSLGWQMVPGTRLNFGSSWFSEQYDDHPPALPPGLQTPAYLTEFQNFRNTYYDRATARWSGFVRGSHDWRPLRLDWTVRHLGDVPRYARRYTALDARLGWQVSRDLELSLACANVGAGQRTEFDMRWFVLPSRTEPEWSLRASWHF